MPNVVLKLDRTVAVTLHNMIDHMTGSAPLKAKRAGIQKAILAAWPEATSGEPTENGVKRDLELDPKDQRALAEGFLSIAGNTQTNNLDFKRLKELAGACRLWTWVESHIQQPQDFDGELDGEPPLVDTDPSAAEPPQSAAA